MSARLASGVLVSALIRRVEAAGGHAAVLARGDTQAGAVLLVLAERGATLRLVERDGTIWRPSGPGQVDEPGAVTDYLARRRRSDPDLWAVELDVAEAARIADGVLAG